MTSNKISPEHRKIIQNLQRQYIPTEAYQTFETLFRSKLEERRADLDAGVNSEIRGIALIGASGSGKSAAVGHFLKANPDLLSDDRGDGACEFFSQIVPSPASMKAVGVEVLAALGYELTGEKSAPLMWNMIKKRLALRGALFLHLDEAQDFSRELTKNQQRDVINTLKSLMNNGRWPVSLILTGMPDLKNLINQDPQLVRRLDAVEIRPLDPDLSHRKTRNLLRKYAEKCGVELHPDLQTEEAARRLLHAADYAFGLKTRYIVGAITRMLEQSGTERALSLSHFAIEYQQRSGALRALNPFIAQNFLRIDTRKILGGDANG